MAAKSELLTEIEFGDTKLRFKVPQRMFYRVNGDVSLIQIDEHCVASTKEHLADDVTWLWKSYALEEDSKLTPKGLEFKRHLLSLMEEVK